MDTIACEQFDVGKIEQELQSYLAHWLSLAQRHPAQTRQILRKLLTRRIRVWREMHGEEKAYHYEGEAAVGRFFSGLVGVKRFGVPNGNISLLIPHSERLSLPFSGETGWQPGTIATDCLVSETCRYPPTWGFRKPEAESNHHNPLPNQRKAKRFA
jgi:hypothetical protein